ncbi:hypothetical protein L6164_031682 [Bauhinia variegata]|uniref:Uncharacterized protein n=1 Tax=Bauhinia variegata TaxID=167791 RepID=A0ACB9LGK9_BAUVA|nr:hypothetical protein L6164_031682 [Bauhinia variegata]
MLQNQSHFVKFYVESINYNNYTIRLVDSGVQQTEFSSIPHYSISFNRVSDGDYPEYVDTASCINWNSNGHIYAIVGHLSAQRLNVGCRVMTVAATSLWGTGDHAHNGSFSYTDIHRALVFGFEVSWFYSVCDCENDICDYNATTGKFDCRPLGTPKIGIWEKLRKFFTAYVVGVCRGLFRIVGRDVFEDYDFDLPVLLGVITGPYVMPRFLFEDGGMNSGSEASSDVTETKTNLRETASDPLLENSV